MAKRYQRRRVCALIQGIVTTTIISFMITSMLSMMIVSNIVILPLYHVDTYLQGAYEQTLGEFDCCTWLDISPLDNGEKQSLQTHLERHSAGKILAAAVSGDDAPESLMQEKSQLGAMLYCIG